MKGYNILLIDADIVLLEDVRVVLAEQYGVSIFDMNQNIKKKKKKNFKNFLKNFLKKITNEIIKFTFCRLL